ncbi:nucleotidyltransferase family protein [Wolffia australiana]
MAEREGSMAGEGVVYETLDSVPFFEDDPLQQYAIFRRQISSQTSVSAGTPATEFFSLDLSPNGEETACHEPSEMNTPSQFVSRSTLEGDFSPEFAWLRAGSRFRSPMVQLHQEILDFCDFLSPTPEEEGIRNEAVKRVFEVIKYIWPHCTVDVFGSYKTGLYLPTSDVDAVILNSKVQTPQMGLKALSRALSQKSIATKIQVIGKARVPIIKFVEKQSGIAFDISFDMHSGPDAAYFIKEAVSKMPPLKPLCLILKVFLKQRELNEVFSGGVGSYALTAMLIAHLQIHWRGQSVLSQTMQEHNLGTLLVSFFDFYGHKLNNGHVGVSCQSPGNFYVKSIRGFFNDSHPNLLSIEDPQQPGNDIGKNSFKYCKVKSAFATAYATLTNARIMSEATEKGILGLIIRRDPAWVNRMEGSKGGGLPLEQPDSLRFQGVGDIFCNWQLTEEEPLPRKKKLKSNTTRLKEKFARRKQRKEAALHQNRV